MEERLTIGIDAGANGGICVLTRKGEVVDVSKMPKTPQDVLEYLQEFAVHSHCFLEKVGGMSGQSGSASFNFGKGYGHLEMALLALKIPTTTVTPQKWQKTYQLGTKNQCASKTEWKNKLKAKAQQLFPSLGKKITLATSDAILIAEYGRLQNV